ncbi:MAG: WYL domain-containing protein [Treponema sp.]|jgi:predicted DNA-binding transcriptional regulator YafY|nr:WYL domain-containing protein [Treponema sp.]
MKTKKKLSGKSLLKTALPRIYRIEKEIASGKFPNSDGLARLLDTSVSTICRDIEFMRDQLFAPIEYDDLNRGYYFTEKTFRLPTSFTGAEDLFALCMARSVFSLYRKTPLYESSRQLLESITTLIALDGNKDWLENRIAVPPIASAKVKLDIWEIIVAGLKSNRIITLDYKGTWDEEYKERKVYPYQLLFDSGVWYLYGFAEERKAARIFSLSKIKNARLTKDVFTLPKNYKYSDFSGDNYFGVFIGQNKQRFAVDFYKDSISFAAERQWAADQKTSEKDDRITIEFTSTQYDKVLRWVLSCGCNAVPGKPKKLVDDWKRHILEMRKLVSKRDKTAF